MSILSEVKNPNLLAELGNQARLGKLFAFFDESVFAETGPLGFVRSMGDKNSGPKIVSLLDVAGTELPGAKHVPLPLQLNLGVLVTDKDLYREGVDTVNLTALDPINPSSNRTVVLEQNGAVFRKIPIRLNMHGLATVPLSRLPVGRYNAYFEGTENELLSFTVAEYRLASLVATLEAKEFRNDMLGFTLELNSFGHPVEGDVTVELQSRGQRLSQATLGCRKGRLSGSFPLRGEGPFSLNVQLFSEPSKTATVPISGSRSSERESTLFGRLGSEIVGSLLPSTPQDQSVRGLFLREEAVTNSPFALERVDSSLAKITARSNAETLTVVVADPTIVRVEPTSETPSCRYLDAAGQHYKDARFAAAIKDLEEGREQHEVPHSRYSYEIARCYARLGRSHEALAWLRRSVCEGWTDWSRMKHDDGFESLSKDSGFQLLCEGGRREFVFHQVRAGQEFEIEVPSPLAFLALGAFVNGKPFEGWSFLVPPSQIEVELKVPESVEPGQELEVEVCTNQPGGVYLVVKDNRLQSTDTPLNRFAGSLKKCVEQARELFAPGDCLTPFQALGTPPEPDFWNQRSLFDEEPGTSRFERPMLQQRRRGLIPRPGAPVEMLRSSVASEQALRRGPALRARESIFLGLSPEAAGSASEEVDYDTIFCDSLEEKSLDLFCAGEAEMDLFEAPEPARPTPDASVAKTVEPSPPNTQEEPEVLFAGILETKDNSVAVKLQLPDNFGQYLIEATVLSGNDFCHQSASLQVKADPYVSIEVPPFVHSLDTVTGRVLASPGARVELYLDEQPQELGEGFTFIVRPGLYRALVTSEEGKTRSQTRRVDEPGRLKRVVQSIRLLKKGESINLQEDPSILSVRVLPGLQKPFKMLVKETANYSHLCCEQTAAKMVSAALMALSGDPEGEAVFVAGCRRMERMYLNSGGFCMYPGSGLDRYWGPKAVLYLLGLAGLEGHQEFTPAMDDALRRTLEMARGSQQVYRISWPAVSINDCQSAYWSLRQAKDPQALPFVANFLKERLEHLTGRVEFRAQACYAAATLLHSRTQISLALELTNRVLDQLEDGRLYSTYDSVAAIILMNELRRAGIGAGGKGVVEVDGRTLSTEEAMKLDRIRHLRCTEKLCMVSVTRTVEENWESFDSTVGLRLSLQKDGRPGVQFKPGDALELKIELEDGYQTGDLVWVCLPDCLSRLCGGGQVKRFSVDFEGLNSLTVALAATGTTGGGSQHFAACVRNMFEEERMGSPGLLKVRVG